MKYAHEVKKYEGPHGKDITAFFTTDGQIFFDFVEVMFNFGGYSLAGAKGAYEVIPKGGQKEKISCIHNRVVEKGINICGVLQALKKSKGNSRDKKIIADTIEFIAYGIYRPAFKYDENALSIFRMPAHSQAVDEYRFEGEYIENYRLTWNEENKPAICIADVAKVEDVASALGIKKGDGKALNAAMRKEGYALLSMYCKYKVKGENYRQDVTTFAIVPVMAEFLDKNLCLHNLASEINDIYKDWINSKAEYEDAMRKKAEAEKAIQKELQYDNNDVFPEISRLLSGKSLKEIRAIFGRILNSYDNSIYSPSGGDINGQIQP
ncbi:hypothetical protein [Selenomonas sp. AB3002]|uniref:hypothetical protein n=1 Tax=Selenomonas sp. AB3002 TaxID=1392502 RepID=UPI000497C9AD